MRRLLLLLVLGVSGLIFSGCTDAIPFLTPQKAGLQVITGDVPATVSINGQTPENTPFIDKDLEPGEYTIEIKPTNPALVSHETTVRLTKGLLSVVTWNPGTRPETSGGVIYEMEKLSDKDITELAIISIPDRSIVSVDGQEKDFTPVILDDLSPGEHEFEIALPSYDSQLHTINLVAGHRVNVSVKLARSVDATQEPNSIQDASASATVSASESAQLTTLATPAASLNLSASGSATVVDVPRVTIQPTNFFNNGEEVLRVRAKAGPGGAELGFAAVGESYSYLGETEIGWYKISFSGKEGWVSGTYAKLEE